MWFEKLTSFHSKSLAYFPRNSAGIYILRKSNKDEI